jgi:phage terminase large subunit
VREYQNSIEDSVYKVLKDQIEALGWGNFYDVQKTRIYGANGTEFNFEGIRNNVNRIKSYEGIDICWAEEAVKVSKNSWGVLIPTIRKEGSEIWLTFNPERRRIILINGCED